MRSGAESASLEELVLDALVVDHEGVSSCAHTDDQTGDAGKVQRITDPAAQQNQGTIGQEARGNEEDEGYAGQRAEVVQRVGHHEYQANEACNEAGLQCGLTQCWWNGLYGATRLAIFTGEGQRQCAILQVISQVLCLFLAKVTSNGGSRANWSCSLNNRCGNNPRVKGDGNLVLEVFLRQVCPGLRTVRAIAGLEGEVDLHLAGLTV